MLVRWQESQSQLDTIIEYLEGKKNVIANTFSRIDDPITIPPTRDSLSLSDNRHSFTAQLPVLTNQLTFPVAYLHIPLPTITSYTNMPAKTNNRITAGNREQKVCCR